MTETTACLHCGLEVPADTWYCPKCRYRVSDPLPGSRPPPPARLRTPEERRWQQAGSILIILAPFVVFVGGFASQNSGTTPETERFAVIMVAVAAVLALAGTLMVRLSSTRSRRRTR